MAYDVTGLGSVFDFAGKILDKVFPDPVAAANAKLELVRAQQAGQLQEEAAVWENMKAQLAVNQVEAGSSNLFVAGWRPFVGWTCGVAFAYKFVVSPFLLLILAAVGHPVTLPLLDFTEMLPVLFGMLGLGAMRSFDKVKGTAPDSRV